MYSIPLGQCQCGCRKPTTVSTLDYEKHGYIKNVPRLYTTGHKPRIHRRFEIDPETECWNWLLGKDSSGYGLTKIVVDGVRRTIGAHRAVYQENKGPIPKGLELDHLCRNRKCVNPNHLEPVTDTENARRGDATKLTPELVREIRTQRELGVQYPILKKRYGMSFCALWSLIERKTWKDV